MMDMEGFTREWLLNPTVGRIVGLVVGVALIWTLMKFLKARFTGRTEQADAKYRVRKLFDVAGYLLVLVLIMVVYSDKLSGFTVALGVAGAGIAFALQEVIASVAGWLAVMFGGFYRTGDRVQLGGIKGDVVDIGVLRTTVMEVGQWVDGDLYNGRIVRVANSFVFKEPVFNYSADFPFLWDEIKVPVMFGSDYERARALFDQVLREVAGGLTADSQAKWKAMVSKFMVEDARTSPWVTMAFNDNWVEFTLRYVVDYKQRRGTKDALFTRLLREIEATDGVIKLASATFQVVGVPPINVKVQKD
ncbi:MAG TPA: mechanosensitive ion channel [Flavobacteriales bacterium]|jgi:small-conductance mechanosensitive channel|nr:mechanosensitive ion channel [Flavobacteriales bacterium]HQW32300.1 mechanosensitive ion channel [Flavobacteriales bacterium]HQY78560.1 mechanosensitive ion channel [Flavobacteriales bacterium]HRA16113.1 mechanosensitive ion channel [Flavobacteriales bacterium]